MLKFANLLSFIQLTCALIILSFSTAYAIEPIQTFVPAAKRVGEARMKYLTLDIYDAELFGPHGQWTKDEPFALRLTYLKSLSGHAIAERSIEEIRKQGFTDEVQLDKWHNQLCGIIPDVTSGASITGIRTAANHTLFFINDIQIGRIQDEKLTNLFFDIWLSSNTTAPRVREKLLGIMQ